MNKRFSLRVPDVMVEALQKKAQRESVRLGRPVDPGTVARDFIQQALEEEGLLPGLKAAAPERKIKRLKPTPMQQVG